MSLSSLRSYFKDRATTLNFKEHKDQIANNPNGTIDKSYQLSYKQFSAVKQNHTDLEMGCVSEVTLFFKGAKDFTKTEDIALESSEDFIKECLKARNRLSVNSIKNLYLENMVIESFDDSNDNTIKAILTFRALIILGLEGQ